MTTSRRLKNPQVPEPALFALDATGTAEFPCPECGNGLDIQQPDPESPEMLLGICQDCGLWCAIGVDEGRGEALLLALPHVALIRAALRERGVDSGLVVVERR